MNKAKLIGCAMFLLASLSASFLGQVPSGKLALDKLREFPGFRTALFARDSKIIALSGSRMGSPDRPMVRLAKVDSGVQVCDYTVPGSFDGYPRSFSPDGKRLTVAYTTFDNASKLTRFHIDVIDTSNCKNVKKLFEGTYSGPDAEASFTEDGRFIVGRTNSVVAWDAESGKELWKVDLPGKIQPGLTRISPDGKWLVVAGYASEGAPGPGLPFGVNLATREWKPLGNWPIDTFEFSDDSSFLYVSAPNGEDRDTRRTKFQVHAIKTGSWERVQAYTENVTGPGIDVFSSKNVFMTGSGDGTFAFHSIPNGETVGEGVYYKRTTLDEQNRVPTMTSIVDHAVLSRDGKYLSVAGPRSTVQLWSVQWK